MLIFYREVDRRDLGKTNEKNVVYVGFFFVFLGDFWASTNQILPLFDIKQLRVLRLAFPVLTRTIT